MTTYTGDLMTPKSFVDVKALNFWLTQGRPRIWRLIYARHSSVLLSTGYWSTEGDTALLLIWRQGPGCKHDDHILWTAGGLSPGGKGALLLVWSGRCWAQGCFHRYYSRQVLTRSYSEAPAPTRKPGTQSCPQAVESTARSASRDLRAQLVRCSACSTVVWPQIQQATQRAHLKPWARGACVHGTRPCVRHTAPGLATESLSHDTSCSPPAGQLQWLGRGHLCAQASSWKV